MALIDKVLDYNYTSDFYYDIFIPLNVLKEALGEPVICSYGFNLYRLPIYDLEGNLIGFRNI